MALSPIWRPGGASETVSALRTQISTLFFNNSMAQVAINRSDAVNGDIGIIDRSSLNASYQGVARSTDHAAPTLRTAASLIAVGVVMVQGAMQVNRA